MLAQAKPHRNGVDWCFGLRIQARGTNEMNDVRVSANSSRSYPFGRSVGLLGPGPGNSGDLLSPPSSDPINSWIEEYR